MTTQTETYSGYTNYPTFAVKLWIDNNQGDQEYWREVTAETLADTEQALLLLRTPEGILADTLKEYFEEQWQHRTNGQLRPQLWLNDLYLDLMAHALARVNWMEIAKELIEEQGE